MSSAHYCSLCFLSMKTGPALVFVLREGVLFVVFMGRGLIGLSFVVVIDAQP